MAGYYDSASSDFNTAINNYKNNVGSVAQSMIQGDIGQVSNAKDLLMEKAGILAGGDEASISDKIQAGMSKTMDELGLDMSVHTIAGKMLPWAAKKLKGKVQNMAKDRQTAKNRASEQTRDDIPEADDAARQDYLDRMGRQDALNDDQVRLPQGGEQNAGAGATDNSLAQPNTGGGSEAQDLDAVTGQPIVRGSVDDNPDVDAMPEDQPRNADGSIMEDEGDRVARITAQNQADDAASGLNPFGAREALGTGNADAMAASRAAQARVDAGVAGDARGAAAAAPARASGGAASEAEAGAGKSSSIQEEFARRQGTSSYTAEEEESLRGDFNPAVRQTLEARGNVSGQTGPASRPDGDIDGIPATPARTAPRAMTAEEAQASRAGDTLTGRITVSQRSGPTAEQQQAALDDQAQIARENEAGVQPARPPERVEPQDRPPVENNLANEEQMTSSGALRDLQAQAATEARQTTSTIGDFEASFGEKAAGAAGDIFGFLGDVLGPAAAIFGGVEAARGIHSDVKDSLDPNNNPFAKVQQLIGSAGVQQDSLNAAISADQFSSKVGAGRPSFGSLAAPTFDSSSIMQGMGGHF